MTSAEATSAWHAILGLVEQRTSTQQFSTWFRNLSLKEISKERVVVSVPSKFHRDWITTYYKDMLDASVAEVLKQSPAIHLEIATPVLGAHPVSRDGGEATRDAERVKNPLGRRALDTEEGAEECRLAAFSTRLIEEMDFDHFVTGESNRLGQAAGLALARSNHREASTEAHFRTLLLLGAVGTGKTHLLQAICREALEHHGPEQVAYIRGESFLNDFVQALSASDMTSFRQRYRSLDFVCFDDLQVLSGKSQSQQELLHTLTAWLDRGARVVFAAACSPGGGLDLDPQLSSQLSSAFRVTLQMPGASHRRLLVQAIAQRRSIDLPEDVLDFLADLPLGSIRELEGSVTSLIAACRLTGVALSLESAQRILHVEALGYHRATSPEKILRTVCEHFEVKHSDIVSRRRPQALSFARHVVMFFLRELTELSLSEIGFMLGGRDHTTVLHGIRKIERDSKDDGRLRDHLSRIRVSLER